MHIEVTLVSAFTANGTGGNPAGVVLNADRLCNAQKLKIAQIVGCSETAFVTNNSNDADYEVSFFTTTEEVDFCGHATLAAFSTMHEQGLLPAGKYTQQTKAGLLPITVESNKNIVMEQQLPKKFRSFTHQEIASLIGIESKVLESTKLPIEIVSTGLPDAIIPIPRGYLDLIKPDEKRISDFCAQYNIVGFHAFELCDSNSNFTASCRNFAPLFGISEESATGSSCGALACYLTEHLNIGNHYVFEQGRAMNCTSIITASVEMDKAAISKVKVGGMAHYLETMQIPIS